MANKENVQSGTPEEREKRETETEISETDRKGKRKSVSKGENDAPDHLMVLYKIENIQGFGGKTKGTSLNRSILTESHQLITPKTENLSSTLHFRSFATTQRSSVLLNN